MGIYLFLLNCKIQCKKKTSVGKINDIWIEEEWWIVEEINLGKIIYDLALTLDYNNFKKVAKKKKKVKLGLTQGTIPMVEITQTFSGVQF